MSRSTPNSKFFRLARRMLVATAVLSVPACGSDESDANSDESGDEATLGSFRLALDVEGEELESATLTLASENLDPSVQRVRVLDLSNSTRVSATEYGLPQGSYTVSLTSQLVSDPNATCQGSVSGIQVVAGEIAAANLVLRCTLDGGDLALAGGIEIDADVEIVDGEDCGPLVEELSVGPLDPFINQSVSLTAVAEPGVAVDWRANFGTISAAGDSYTCPHIPGAYEVVARFTRDENCVREVRQVVRCHAEQNAECQPLPEKVAFAGSCGMRSPCHIEQDGCTWSANCRGRYMNGEGLEDGSFPFYNTSGQQCDSELVDGVWQGSCSDEDGNVCDFVGTDDPDPVPFCDDIAEDFSQITACGQTYSDCSVIQDGCRIQVSCDDGAMVASGGVSDTTVSLRPTIGGNSFTCSGEFEGDDLAGECVQRRGGDDPITCDDFSVTAVPQTGGEDCNEVLPEEGFQLAGCGLDGLCFAVQRGCAWQIACDQRRYSGLEDGSGQFPFSEGEQDCVARVENGEVVGSCTDANGASCEFAPAALSMDNTCHQLAPDITTGGCGAFFDCDTIQDDCNFLAQCQGGEFMFSGTSSPTGLEFPGLNGYTCEVELNDSADRLLGACTRENPDGSISECRDVSDSLGARFVVDWEQSSDDGGGEAGEDSAGDDGGDDTGGDACPALAGTWAVDACGHFAGGNCVFEQNEDCSVTGVCDDPQSFTFQGPYNAETHSLTLGAGGLGTICEVDLSGNSTSFSGPCSYDGVVMCTLDGAMSN